MKKQVSRYLGFMLFPLVALLVMLQENEDDFIDWHQDRKLVWADFKGTPETGLDRAALSSIKITADFSFRNTVFSWKIYCRFNRKKSWGKVKTAYILQHEQAHFDITEIHARRLHQRLSEYSFNPKTYQKDIQGLYNRTIKEENEMQSLYDRETHHSIEKEKQEAWLKKVEKMLQETTPYAGYHSGSE